MKKGITLTVIVLSILLVGLYMITSTYAVIIEVTKKDGALEIINDITLKDVLSNDDGTFNSTYYMIKDELSQEICRKHGMDIDNYLLCEIEPDDFYNDIGWRDECYLRMMHFDRELYNSPGGIKWITDVGWKFDREQYENCTAYLKKAYNIEA